MKRMFMVTYRYREGIGEEGSRKLTEKFLKTGDAPGVIAHYERLDGKGGFVLQELLEDPERTFEFVIQYTPFIEFDVVPVTTIEDAFPVIQRVYG